MILKTIYDYRVVFSLLDKSPNNPTDISKEWHPNTNYQTQVNYSKACKNLSKKGILRREPYKKIHYKYYLNKNKVYEIMTNFYCNDLKQSPTYKNPTDKDKQVFKRLLKNKLFIRYIKDRLKILGIVEEIPSLPYWFLEQNEDSNEKSIVDFKKLIDRLSIN